MLRSTTSAFTRVFDTLWWCAADPGVPIEPLWVPALRSSVNAAPRPGHGKALRPCPGKRKTAHRADAHFARNTIARDLAGELECQRHRVGDGDLPGDVVAVGLAVEDLGRIAVGGLRTRQRAAGILQAERRISIAHRRAHGDVPVSVDGHSRISSSCLRKTGKRFWDRAKLPAV